MEIRYVPKQELYPRFGWWDHENKLYLIRDDLPKCMQEFVLAHEKGHEKDKQQNDFDCDPWLINEMDANVKADAIINHFAGFVLTCLYSLAPYRLRYYWQRFKEGK